MRTLFSMLFILLAVDVCFSAEIKSLPAKDNRLLITITGELVPGDTEIFKAAVKSANDAGKLVSNIRLNSTGGNLVEGVKLADVVRFGKISTNVGKDAICASACFLVFAAGTTKFANYTAQIGVHGASNKNGEEAGDGTVAMARVAKELGVPPAIIGRMVITPPNEMVWLSPQDLRSMDTAMVGKPSQVPSANQVPNSTPNQTRPGGPVELNPDTTTKASTPPAPTWDDYVKRAIALSAEQNNGRAKSGRTCQPELKVCINGVQYRDKNGVETLAKITRDLNDRTISKEICTFNSQRDIRKCFNWDTLKTHRDMQDAKGDWIKVADD